MAEFHHVAQEASDEFFGLSSRFSLGVIGANFFGYKCPHTALGLDDARMFELQVCPADGVGVYHQVNRNLAHRGQLIAWTQAPRGDKLLHLLDDLYEYRHPAFEIEFEHNAGISQNMLPPHQYITLSVKFTHIRTLKCAASGGLNSITLIMFFRFHTLKCAASEHLKHMADGLDLP